MVRDQCKSKMTYLEYEYSILIIYAVIAFVWYIGKITIIIWQRKINNTYFYGILWWIRFHSYKICEKFTHGIENVPTKNSQKCCKKKKKKKLKKKKKCKTKLYYSP